MKNRQVVLGMVFAGGALLCGLLALCSSIASVNRVQRLTPITSVTVLGDVPAGNPILIEGRVSDRNPVNLEAHGFVAYLREGRAVVNARGTPSPGNWSVRERVTPPLWLELSGGLVYIENDDYDLEKGKTIEVTPSAFHRYSGTRYNGIEIGDPVIAVGAVSARGAQPHLKADFVARGTHASYVASQRNAGVIFFVGSVLVAILGGIFILQDQVRGIYVKIKRAGGGRSRSQSG